MAYAILRHSVKAVSRMTQCLNTYYSTALCSSKVVENTVTCDTRVMVDCQIVVDNCSRVAALTAVTLDTVRVVCTAQTVLYRTF